MPVKPPTLDKRARLGRLVQPARRSSAARGYGYAWRKLRGEFINENPLCVRCLEAGRVVSAEHVDHIIPIARAPKRRFDKINLQALCASCHARKTAKEDGGFGN